MPIRDADEPDPLEAPRRTHPLPAAPRRVSAEPLRADLLSARWMPPAPPAAPWLPTRAMPRDSLSSRASGASYALLHDAISGADVPDDQHDGGVRARPGVARPVVATTQGRPTIAACLVHKPTMTSAREIPAAVEAALQGGAAASRPRPRAPPPAALMAHRRGAPPHPRSLEFNPEGHVYRVDGMIVPSVTQLLDDAGLTADYKPPSRPRRPAHAAAPRHPCRRLLRPASTRTRWTGRSRASRKRVPYVESVGSASARTTDYRPAAGQVPLYHPGLRYTPAPPTRSGTLNGSWVVVERKATTKMAATYGLQTAGYAQPGFLGRPPPGGGPLSPAAWPAPARLGVQSETRRHATWWCRTRTRRTSPRSSASWRRTAGGGCAGTPGAPPAGR